MAKPQRLPRRVHLGLGNIVEVVLASQSTIRDVMELEDDDTTLFEGCWVSYLGELDAMIAGIIYVDQKLNARARRSAYWHELGHALIDIRDWSMDETKRKV